MSSSPDELKPLDDTDALVSTVGNSANASTGGLARNALFSYGATLVGALTGLLVTPLLLRHLGEEPFGLWILLLSTVGYLGLLEIGLYFTVSKRVAECLALNDEARLQTVLSTALLMYGILSLLVLPIIGVLGFNVERFFHISGQTVVIARECLWVLGLNQIAVFAFRLQPAILFGAGRLDLLTGVATIANLGTALGTIVLAIMGYNIVALAICTLAATIFSGLMLQRATRHHVVKAPIHPRHASREMVRELLKFGSRNATLSVAGAIAFGADALVIGLLLPVANVAHYAVASKLVNLVRELCQKPVDVLMPAYSHSEASRDVERQWHLWSESISLSMAICLPFVVAIWAFGDRLIRAWVGPTHPQSYSIAVVLAGMILLQLPGHASFMLLTGTERNAVIVRIYIVAAIFNLALSVILTHSFGPIGVALGSFLVVAVVDFFLLPRIVCREFGFGLPAYARQSLLPLLPCFVGACVPALICKYLLPQNNTFVTLAMLGVVALCAWASWSVWGIDTARREAYVRTARRVLGKFAPAS